MKAAFWVDNPAPEALRDPGGKTGIALVEIACNGDGKMRSIQLKGLSARLIFAICGF